MANAMTDIATPEQTTDEALAAFAQAHLTGMQDIANLSFTTFQDGANRLRKDMERNVNMSHAIVDQQLAKLGIGAAATTDQQTAPS